MSYLRAHATRSALGPRGGTRGLGALGDVCSDPAEWKAYVAAAKCNRCIAVACADGSAKHFCKICPKAQLAPARVARVALSGAASTIANTINAGYQIVSDPALPEVTRLVLKMHQLQARPPSIFGKYAVKGLSATVMPGIGLQKVVRPLKFYVYAQENWWVLPGIVAGILGLPFLLGYKMGRRRNRRAA